jgi:uncharacterized membrane protein
MMLEVFISILYAFLSLLQILLAPKIGPNPYFGFRIGYTFSNPIVWKKTNLLIGSIMLLHSLILLFLSLIDISLLLYILLFMGPLILIMIAGIIYASHKLEEYGRGEIKKVEPVRPLEASFIWKNLGMIFFFILLTLMAITYNSLPDNIAVHFDMNGTPNGWSNKNDFFLWYLVFSIIYLGIVYLIVYVGKKYPIALHSGVMRIGRDTTFKSSILAMNLVILVLIITYVGIYFANVKPESSEIISYVVIFIFSIVFVPIGYIIYRWNRVRKGVEE